MTKLEHALHLASQGFYVFPVIPGGKTPAIEDWQQHATRDPEWIELTWIARPNCNIGIYTGKFGNGAKALLCVDVDNKGAKNGDRSLLELELAGHELPTTFEQSTPTGGRHFVFVVDSAVKQGANVLGDGLDTRSRGGYIVGAGSETSNGRYDCVVELPPAQAPQWLIDRCGKPREKSAAVEAPANVNKDAALQRAIHYLDNEAPAGEAGARNHTGYLVAARVKDFGVGEGECLGLLLERWKCEPMLDHAEVEHVVHSAYRYGTEPVGAAAPEAQFKPVEQPADAPVEESLHPFEKLNTEFAFVIAGGGHHILWETQDERGRAKLEHLAESSFHKRHAAQLIQISDKKVGPITEEWMRWKGRRSYDGIVFQPGMQAPDRFYNLWRGFAVEPAETSDNPGVQMFLDHALHNVCRGDKALFRWLMGWFAHIVQRPAEKPLTALVFRGGKGVGKNALVERVGYLLGGHFLLSSNRRYLVGNFNGHLESLLLFTLDEAFWSGDKQAEGQLKDLVTGKEHVIEHKGKEPYKVDNRTRVAIIGNEDWLVPASHDERRFAVFDVGDGRKQDRDFFRAMREHCEAGGYACLLRYLLDFDISQIDINASPATSGLVSQKIASLDLVPQWWHGSLAEGSVLGADFEGWPEITETSRLRQAFERWAKTKNIRGRLPTEDSFGRAIHQCCKSVARKQKRMGGNIRWMYELPTIDQARAEFDVYIGHKIEWAEHESA